MWGMGMALEERGPERSRTGGDVASRFCRTECVAFVVDTRSRKKMRPLGEKLRFGGIITGGMSDNGECVLGLKKGKASKLVQLWDV